MPGPNPVAVPDNTSLAMKRPRPLQITPKVRRAIQAMVYDGADYKTAANTAGMSTFALRTALAKPHVAAYLKSELQVLRAARSPKNFHRLCEIADADNNMPAVNAIKAMELGVDDERRPAAAQAPGVTVRIINVTDGAVMRDVSPTASASNIDAT